MIFLQLSFNVSAAFIIYFPWSVSFLLPILSYSYFIFSFLLKKIRNPFNISYNTGLLVRSYIRCFFSGKCFVFLSILNDSIAGENNLGCRFLLIITLNILCHSLLVCTVSAEISADSLMGVPLYVTDFLLLLLRYSLCL